ncbi:MAG TPA: hypothetical protein VHQ47_10125 [Phycisphaerae bacterium]|nr:hypothetical protein [Phycisphaerae bacterium]
MRLAAEAPQFFSPPATPSARPVVDNYELSLLLQKIGSDARTTTITAPRAAIPNHHTGTIPYPTTDTHGQPAELLVLLRPMLIVPQPADPGAPRPKADPPIAGTAAASQRSR